MTFKHTFLIAFRRLKVNTVRTLLTLLGILIGITAIIVIMSVGRSANQLIVERVQGLGSRTIIVVPGRQTADPTSLSSLFVDSLKDRELLALRDKRRVPYLLDITPVMIVPGSVAYEDESLFPTILGADVSFADILDIHPIQGQFFTPDAVKRQETGVVIGHEVREELFGDAEAVGEKIKINNTNVRILGVLPERGRIGLFNIDDMVVLPYTAARAHLVGQQHYNEFIVRATSEALVPSTVRDIELTLRELHRIADPEDDDFHIHTQVDITERIGAITQILSVLLAAVAAISLVVGGIGIMNIMLVSVSERTNEIGLRKAVGATSSDILRQFLLEAVLLTVMGGVMGIILGAGISYFAGFILGKIIGVVWKFVFPTAAAALGLALAIGTGLIFGIYPALLAARKDPIEALRSEQ